jgi:hypothetical protein
MNPMVKHRKLGTFGIPYVVINDLPQHVQAILQDCIVLGAYRDNQLGYVSYLGIHKDFAEVEFGKPIPFYIYEVTENTSTDARITRRWYPSDQPKTVIVPQESEQ